MRHWRILVLHLLVLGTTSPVAASYQGPWRQEANVEVTPSVQEAAPGAQVLFTVSATSTLGGTLVITLGPELSLFGEPYCNGSCRAPITRGDGSIVEVTFDSQWAVVYISAMLSSTLQTGDTVGMNVHLVGGPQAVEMAGATVYVSGTLPTPASSSLEDNRLIYIDMNPRLLRIAPGGDVLYHIQPVRWGMWSGQEPTVTVEISVPREMTETVKPLCGRGDLLPVQYPCDTQVSTSEDGRKTYSIRPGYNPADGAMNGIYLVLKAGEDVAIGSSMQIQVVATVDDSTLSKQPEPVFAMLHVVSKDSLLVSRSNSGNVGAILEVKQNFTTSGSICGATEGVPQIGLYAMGLDTKFATATVGTGQLGEALDGTGARVCLIPLAFTDVPLRFLYIVARASGEELPCNACVYGLVTRSHDAEVVFPEQ